VLFRTIVSAIFAGIVAGSLLFLVQRATLLPLIHQAELREAPSDKHEAADEPSQDPTTRTTYTLIGDILLACGFGLFLTAAYIVTDKAGIGRGICWGMTGFAIFHLGPAIVAPPLIPGLEQGSLATRQELWLVAVIATASGLALLTLGQTPLRLIGASLLAMPLLATRMLQSGTTTGLGSALEAPFILWSLVASALMWLFLGAISGAVFEHLRPQEDP
jgi:cobalt transporter subunit CbtA